MIPKTPAEMAWMIVVAIGSLAGACAPVFLSWILKGQRQAKTERDRMHDENQRRLYGIESKVQVQNGRIGYLEARVGRVEHDLDKVGGA